MKHGSLFSGIGGFDLAADWMRWENIFHCEIAEFPRKILNHYWPNAECHEDIKKTDFTKYRGTVDIISGGFPCQPYSAAGKRLGKEDDRHLWPEMLRVIREVKPQWVVGENVRGLLNWNGGMVFHEVCSDLENIGYEVQAFIIPASGINAPHQRERLWIVAHSINCGYSARREQDAEEDRLQKQYRSEMDCREFNRTSVSSITTNSDKGCGSCDTVQTRREEFKELYDLQSDAPDTESQRTWEQSSENRGREDGRFNDISEDGDATDTNIKRLKKFNYANKSNGEGGQFDKKVLQIQNWDRFPTQSPVCGGDDGISHGLDNITFPKWRNESIKGYGNAIVPQIVYRIFKTIEYIQNLKQ
jgi:DNA (cytosine-5)-methyltransferase 1